MAMIVTRAPTRIDFGGGWTDVPPYSERDGGFVCNVAITRYATARLSGRDGADGDTRIIAGADRSLVAAAAARLSATGVSITLENDFPFGAGLGGSSAAGVAVVAAIGEWQGASRSPEDLAELSREVETTEMGIPGGRQDHYAAAFGGALALRFSRTVTVTKLDLSPATRAELARRCLVIYTGQSRISGSTITAVLGAYEAGEPRVTTALRRMRELAEQMPAALAAGRFDDLGALVDEQWIHQRSLDPAIPTPRIDAIIERAREAGSCGAKALGASGGGCVLVIARDDAVDDVRAAIADLGQLIDYHVDTAGVTLCRSDS
jgi:D-glycero-alpha-D-manno-heptose-7-phosphate kinase